MSIFRRKSQGSAPAAPAAPTAAATASGGDARVAAILSGLRQELAGLSSGQLTPETIDPRAHLFDYGYLDSFKSAEFLVVLQRRYGVVLPEVELVGRLCTLEALATHLAQQTPER